MGKIIDLRPTRPRDLYKQLIANSKATNTRPHGEKVAGPGDSLAFLGADGAPRVLDAGYVDQVQADLDAASGIVEEAREAIAAAEVRLAAADERIATAELELTATEQRRQADALRLTEVEGTLATATAGITAANDRITAAGTAWSGTFSQLDTSLTAARGDITRLSTDLTALDTRTTAARTVADKATADLKITDQTLATARTEITTLTTTLATARTEITTLSGTLMAVDSRALAAKTTADRAETNIAATNTQLTTTRGELEDLGDRIGTVEGSTAAISTRVTTAQTQADAAAIRAQEAWDYAQGLDPGGEGSDSYTAAMDAARKASEEALAAMNRANAAYTSATGKSSVRNATTAPQGVGLAPGDLWRRWSAFPSGVVIAEWTWDGTAWRPATIGHQMITSVDLGTATVGRLHGSYLSAGSVTTQELLVGFGGNLFPDSTLADPEFMASAWDASRIGAPGSGYADGGSILIEAGEGQRGAYWGSGAANSKYRIPVTPGSSYAISARVRTAIATTDTSVRIYFRAYNSRSQAVTFAEPSSIGLPAGSSANIWHALTGTIKIPDGYDQLAIGFFANGGYPGSVRFSAPTTEPAADGHLLVDGAIEGRHLNVTSAAIALAEIIKVKAVNVEVTEALAARVVSAMDVATRNLVVTGSTTLSGKTYIEDLAAGVVSAAKVSTAQLVAASASLDVAVANKLFADIFAVRKVTAAEITVTSTLSAEVARLMSVASRNLVVTGSTTLSGKTYIEDLAAGVVSAAKVSTAQLVAASASLDVAVANKLFADIFAANKIGARELYVGSPSNLIPGGWGAQTRAQLPGWEAFGLNVNTTQNAGQPAEASFWIEGRKNGVANVLIAVDPGRKYRFSVRARANMTGSRFYVQLMTNDNAQNPYMVSNQVVPNGSWQEFTGEWTPQPGTTMVNGINVYANHSNGTVTTATQWFGAFTLASEVPGVLIQDGTIDTPKLNVTESMAAAIVRAGRTETTDLFVTGDAVLKRLTVELPAVFGDIQATGKITGRDAILTGTIDVTQLNVTETMAARLVDAMEVRSKRLIVTEDTILQRATVITSITTPLVNALETRTRELLAEKASIGDLAAGNVVLSGTFRSGPVGEASVIIPKPYTTGAGFDQVGVWLTHDGKAPSQGADYGAAAGMWFDQAALTNPTAPNFLWLRGRNGGGVIAQGDLHTNGVLRTATLAPRVGQTQLKVDAGGGTEFTGVVRTNSLAPRPGNTRIHVDAGGGVSFAGQVETDRITSAGGGLDISTVNKLSLAGNFPELVSLSGAMEVRTIHSTLTLKGQTGLVAQTNGNIAFREMNGSPYNQGFVSGTIVSLGINTGNGRIERLNSSARYKTDIQTAPVDKGFLEPRTVTYVPIGTAGTVMEVDRRLAEGDCQPLTREESICLAVEHTRFAGRLAEEAYAHPSTRDQVTLDDQGRPDSYDYTRDGTKLIPIVREHDEDISAHGEQLREQRNLIQEQAAVIRDLLGRIESLEAAS